MIRQSGSITMALLAGILMPVLIWVALFVAVREPLLRSVRVMVRAGLFVLAGLLYGILAPFLIFVAFLVAIRQPLLQAARRLGYAVLFFLVGILYPVLIWVALAAATRKPLLRWWRTKAVLKPATFRQWRPGALGRASPVLLVLLAPILVPVLVWTSLTIVFRELLLRWRESRLPTAMVCRVDLDCPPGYVCLGGKCVPQY